MQDRAVKPVADRLGQQVRDARERQGLRQDELAVAAGVSTRVVHQIEAGKPTSRLDVLVKVLRAAGLELRADRRDGMAARAAMPGRRPGRA